MAKVNGTQKGAEVEYLTIKQIREYTGAEVAAIRAALKSHEAFKGEGVVREREIPGTDYPPIKEAQKSAVDAWVKARAEQPKGGPASRVRDGAKRYIVRLPAASLSGQTGTLTVGDQSYTVTLEQAFKSTKKAAKPAETISAKGADVPAAIDQVLGVQAETPEGEGPAAQVPEGVVTA